MVRALQLLIGLLATFGLNSCLAQEMSTSFVLSVSGELVERLEPGTIITVSTLDSSEEHRRGFSSARLEDLPLLLPVADYRNRYTRVFFRSPTLKQDVFSMEMDPSLLDKPKPINLLLIKPTASLRTTMNWGFVRFTARVSKSMRYHDLPYWDPYLKKLVPMPNPLQLKYTIGNANESLTEMGGICMDFKWFANIPDDLRPESDVKIKYSVQYESGGIFDPISSNFEYDFQAGQN